MDDVLVMVDVGTMISDLLIGLGMGALNMLSGRLGL